MSEGGVHEWDKDEEIKHLQSQVKQSYAEISRLRNILEKHGISIEEDNAEREGGLWLFGYGSLIYNAGSIPFTRKVTCYTKGWKRLFDQKSTDHRGTPQNPGRTLTMVKSDDKEEKLWGVAYFVPEQYRVQVEEYLDYREKDGYDPVRIAVFDEKENLVNDNVLVYVGKPENMFPKTTNLAEVATHIKKSKGPSGPNEEYAVKVQQEMRKLNMHDDYIFEIASHLSFISEN